MQEFESLVMKPTESIEVFKTRALNMVTMLCSLRKNLTHEEINLKIVRALTKKWQMMKELYLAMKDLNLFS